jgi:hypothetical protein
MAAHPSNASVTIDGLIINCFSTMAGIASVADYTGMPNIGSMTANLEFSCDIHDQKAVPFDTVRKLYNLCLLPTKDKVKDVKIEFWTDDARSDVILSLTLKGWLSSWNVSSGGGKNHVLSFTVQPQLSKDQYIEMTVGN